MNSIITAGSAAGVKWKQHAYRRDQNQQILAPYETNRFRPGGKPARVVVVE